MVSSTSQLSGIGMAGPLSLEWSLCTCGGLKLRTQVTFSHTHFSCLAHTLSPTISVETLLPESVSLRAADEGGTRLATARIAKSWPSVAILVASRSVRGGGVSSVKEP